MANSGKSAASGAAGRGEVRPEVGDVGGLFEGGAVAAEAARPASARGVGRVSPAASGVRTEGVVRSSPSVAQAFGRGPVAADPRKFKYDVTQARADRPVTFGATRADRLDAAVAGDMLHRLHETYGIANEPEALIAAFDKALFWEHTVNGASLLQPGRGQLFVGVSAFDLAPVKALLGNDQRRFFRAYADEIADVNREVLAAFDPYDPVAAEKYGQLMQVAVERGLQKYPYLAHDSSDAGTRLSVEERVALVASKRSVLTSTVNNADKIVVRAPGGAGGGTFVDT